MTVVCIMKDIASGCIVYEGGLSCALIGGLWGFMDAKGKVLIEPVFKREPQGSDMGNGWTRFYEPLTEDNLYGYQPVQ